jgi:sugar O-acyltransferase (sialic acid O-acetyltransferase NeuD family)
MVLYGASGHSKVIIEALIASGGNVIAIFDDNEEVNGVLNYKVSGKYDDAFFPDVPRIISIGSNLVRMKIAKRLNCSFGNVVHPTGWISSTVKLGEGTVVMGNVIVQADAQIGRHVILNTSSSIDHDCIIHDFVHISPGAVLCGGVTIGEGTQVGAGATIIQNIKVGKWAIIGAGSVIVNDIPDHAVVRGVPGRVVRKGA